MPYIGRSENFGVRTVFHFLASNGDTSVSGADVDGKNLSFADGNYIDVYLNGVLLKPTTDYNTSTANTIAGLSALNTNDEVTVVVYDVFTVADMVSYGCILCRYPNAVPSVTLNVNGSFFSIHI